MVELSSAGVNWVGKVLCETEAGVEVLSSGKTGWVKKNKAVYHKTALKRRQ